MFLLGIPINDLYASVYPTVCIFLDLYIADTNGPHFVKLYNEQHEILIWERN